MSENAAANNENILCPSTQIENVTDIKNDDTDLEILTESRINTYAFNTKVDGNNCKEHNLLKNATEVSETDFDEDCEEHSSI